MHQVILNSRAVARLNYFHRSHCQRCTREVILPQCRTDLGLTLQESNPVGACLQGASSHEHRGHGLELTPAASLLHLQRIAQALRPPLVRHRLHNMSCE